MLLLNFVLPPAPLWRPWAAWYGYWTGNEPKHFYAYIKRTSDGAWIGDINFHYTPGRDWWDMGIVIYTPYRSREYAVPALRLMVAHAFRDCGVTRLHNDFEVERRAALKATWRLDSVPWALRTVSNI